MMVDFQNRIFHRIYRNGMTDEDVRELGLAEIPRFVNLQRQSSDSLFGKYKNSLYSSSYDYSSGYYNETGIRTANQCESQLNQIEIELENLEIRKEMIQIALCSSLDAAVSSKLSKRYVEDIYRDYIRNGFGSKKFKDFFKEIKEAFFSQKDSKDSLDWTSELDCYGFDGGRWDSYDKSLENYQCSNSHVMIWFVNNKTKKEFTLHIPVAEKSVHTIQNLNDPAIGRYYLTGVYWNTSKLMTFKANDIAKWIMEMMTTEIHNGSYCTFDGVTFKLDQDAIKNALEKSNNEQISQQEKEQINQKENEAE